MSLDVGAGRRSREVSRSDSSTTEGIDTTVGPISSVAALTTISPAVAFDFTEGVGNLVHSRIPDTTPAYPDIGAPTTLRSGDATNNHHFDPASDSQIAQVNLTIDGSSRTYVGYNSSDNENQDLIRAFYTDSLDGSWSEYSGNPILGTAGGAKRFLWPTTAWDGTTLHMFLKDNVDTQIERWTSTDGTTFSFQEAVVTSLSPGNAFIWQNPDTSLWQLLYVVAVGDIREVRMRQASSLADMDTATAVTLIRGFKPFAAPSITKFGGLYWLAVESKESTVWVTNLYYSKDGGEWRPVANNPVQAKDEANFLHRFGPNGNTMHGYSIESAFDNNWRTDAFSFDPEITRGHASRVYNPSWENDATLGRTVLGYDGTSTFVTLPPNRYDNYTFVVVSRIDDANSGSLEFDMIRENVNGVQMRYNGSGQYVFIHYDDSGAITVASPTASSDTWTMWTQTFDGSTVTAYKNDSESNSKSASSHDEKGNASFTLGSQAPRSDSGYLTGAQAFYLEYPAALSASEVGILYDALLG